MARILFVIRPDIGGAFNNVVDLTHALVARGHEVETCGPLAHRRDRLAGTVTPIEIARPVSPLADLRAAAAFAGVARRRRPDLIHAHGSKGGAVGRLARLRSPSIPVVFTPNLYAFDNYFAKPSQRVAYRAVERTLAPLGSRIICVCEAERRLTEGLGAGDRARLVYNGVHPVKPTEPHPKLASLASDRRVICTVAELRESKGVLNLIEAMPAILAREPKSHLAIAGDGPERPAIENRIAALGLGDSVTLLGHTDGPASALSPAELFVNPAYAEAFPYTVIEAMSMGLPVVATDVGGTAEAFEDGSSGLIIPPGDVGALTAAILAVLEDPERAAKLGAAARHRFEQRFTLDRMVADTLDVYREVGVG